MFENLAAEGRKALGGGHFASAAETLARGLSLWRGHALEDMCGYEWLLPFTARLEQIRLAAIEDQIDARLSLGQHTDLAIELTAMAARYPLRERLWGQFMLALHRCGRSGQALQAFEQLCKLMDAELGIAPNPGLRHLRQQISSYDPRLRQARPLTDGDLVVGDCAAETIDVGRACGRIFA